MSLQLHTTFREWEQTLTTRSCQAGRQTRRGSHRDACGFVVLDLTSYDVIDARVLDVDELQKVAKPTSWVNGFRVTIAQILGFAGGPDVAGALREAYDRLPDHAPVASAGGAP